jgi:acetate---CoA ligase (ADP-forming)
VGFDLSPLLRPRSVAVVGASPNPEILRGRLLKVLLQHGFPGPVYPVTRSHREVQGLPAYASIADVPGPVDLAVVIVPAAVVPETLDACGARGVRAAVVISSGFGEERGEAGRERQQRLREVAARHGMVVCGPNCEGVVEVTAPLVATFSPALEHTPSLVPDAGGRRSIGVVSQSGGMSFTYFNRGRPRQLRFSYLVSSGNEAVLEGVDYVDWMLDDGRTDIVLMYIEAIRNAERFRDVASKAAGLGKPLIVAKMGRSEAGQRAVVSHTGSLAGSDDAYDAMFRHHGVIRAGDIDEMLDIALAFSFCPLPRGRRVALVSGSGGGAVWMADTLVAHGLELPELDEGTRKEIDRLIPLYGTSQNPVDLTAQSARQLGYARVIEMLAASPVIDAIVVVGSLASDVRIRNEAEALPEAVKRAGKPVLFCTYTLPLPRAITLLAAAGIPSYTSMPNCARALRALADYAEFQERWARRTGARAGGARRGVSAGAPHAQDRPLVARGAVDEARLRLAGSPARVLTEYEAKATLALYGVPRLGEELARDEREAVAAAGRVGFPVALKVQSPDVAHKTDAGGVALGLASADAVRAAYREVMDRVKRAKPGARIDGVLVQAMAPRGQEMIVGVSRDTDWGPMLMVGLGGIHVEVLHDVALSPVPLDHDEALALVRRLRGARLLDGVRGELPADVDALAEVMVSLGRFAADHAELIQEIDLNPVIVHAEGRGVSIVDALIVTRSAPGQAPLSHRPSA